MSLVRFDLSWLAPQGLDKGADRTLMTLLAGVRATGSVAGAARSARLSYRHAWGTFVRWEQALGQKLLLLERGRGATLAPLGERLLDAEGRLRRRIDPALARLAAELETSLAGLAPRGTAALRIVASHDLALLRLRDLAAQSALAIDLQVRGSSESLAAYSRGECELAGFHLIAGHPDIEVRRWIDPRRDALLRFAIRRQGLMVRRGNPRHIRAIADLARPAVRFVNRQAGSGTRALFDRLLAQAGMKPRQIRGYLTEEYTHLAVAATVASGMADAGFGIEAAAAPHGLDFIPVATEEYLLACKLTAIRSSPVSTLRRIMAGAAFRNACADLIGYNLARAGKPAALATVVRTFRKEP